MGIGAWLIIGGAAAALEGLWLGCQDVWGKNPVRGYRLDRYCRKLSDTISERARGLSEEDILLSAEIEDLYQRYDQATIAYHRYLGHDPFKGGAAEFYWSMRIQIWEQRTELLKRRPRSVQPLLMAPPAHCAALSHTPAIGTSRRLALPRSS